MNSTSPPPPPSQSNPAPTGKKPSALASCILLGLILGALGAVGGGGFWAYKTFVAKSGAQPSGVASREVKPAPSPQPETAPKPSPDPLVAQTTPSKPSVIESLPKRQTEPKPATPDPLAAPITPAASTPDPVPAPAPPPAEPTPAVPPVPTPAVPTGPADETPAVVATAPEVTPDTPTTPLPEPEVSPAGETADPVVAPEPIQSFAPESPQVAALKADADRRINEAPADLYSDSDKDRVRAAIRSSKHLTRVATLQFGRGAAALGSNEKNRLKKALLSSEAETLLSDPQAVFFIIGFADATGASDTNRKISQKRAAGVADVLKTFKVSNTSYPVGIGSTTLLSADKQSKNRAAEVWIVQP